MVSFRCFLPPKRRSLFCLSTVRSLRSIRDYASLGVHLGPFKVEGRARASRVIAVGTRILNFLISRGLRRRRFAVLDLRASAPKTPEGPPR